jgi:Tissue inhibitor of metalloproteinase/Prealbumin-like fold domain
MEMRNRDVRCKRNYVRLIRLLALLPLLLFVEKAQACSCAPSGPPCQAFWQADAVFIATVKSKSIVPTQADGETKRGEQLVSVIFLVDEVYRGLLGGSDVEVFTGMGGGDCGFNFEKGRRYLVYAQDYQNKLRTGICSRTRLLTDAKKDLLYFQNLPPEGSGASILVKVLKRSASQETMPLQGVKIIAEGPDKVFEGRTDRSGQYEFKHLPAGKYKVKGEIAQASVNLSQTEVTVADRACVELEFFSNIERVGPERLDEVSIATKSRSSSLNATNPNH